MTAARKLVALAVFAVVPSACFVSPSALSVGSGSMRSTSRQSEQDLDSSTPATPSRQFLGRTSRQFAAMTLIDAALRDYGWQVMEINREQRLISTGWRVMERSNQPPQKGMQCDDVSRTSMRVTVIGDVGSGEFHASAEVREAQKAGLDVTRRVNEEFSATSDALRDAVKKAETLPDTLVARLAEPNNAAKPPCGTGR